MFLSSHSKIVIHQKGKASQLPFTNIYSKTGLLSKNLISKPLNKTSTSKKINYIHYTFSEKTNKLLHKAKSNKNHNKILFNSNLNTKPKLHIVNEYLKSFKKSLNLSNSTLFLKDKNNTTNSSLNKLYNTNKNKEINYNNYNNIFNKEEFLNKNNISKISNSISFKSFLNDNNGSTHSKIEPYELIQLGPNNSKNNTNNIHTFSKLKLRSVINSSIPIFKKINILKEAKISINQMQKNKFNNSSSYKTFFEESNISKYNNNENKNIFENDFYKEYYSNNIYNKKPIIIKYFPKPKLSVPKYVNINNINLE